MKTRSANGVAICPQLSFVLNHRLSRECQSKPQPVPLAGANLTDASMHTCIDMNGKVFEWGFSNVPFAAICDARPDAAK